MGLTLGDGDLAAGFRNGFFDAVLNVHFTDIHNSRQLGDEEKSSPVQHPLFTEGERLDSAEVHQILKDFGNMENRAGAHFLRIFLEAVFPILLCEKLITTEE